MLDDEVCVDQVEGCVGKRERGAKVCDDEPVEGCVLTATAGVEINAHELRDPIAVARQAGSPPTAGLQNGRPRDECQIE